MVNDRDLPSEPDIISVNQETGEDDCRTGSAAVILSNAGSDYADEDCDCACAQNISAPENDCRAPAAVAVRRAPLADHSFSHPAGAHTAALPNGHYLVQSPYTPAGPVVLGPAAWERWQAFTTPSRLTNKTDHRLAELWLLQPLGRAPEVQPGRPDTLTAWLHVTNACNLDCPYCYVRKSSARMSLETGRRAVESLFRAAQAHGFRAVKLKYAGGEATLHFQLVRQLHDYARTLARQTGLGLREVVLSNGVHIRPLEADWLLAEGVKLMISLDGVGELHNQVRPLRNRDGYDTFRRVEHTVDHVLLPRGLRPDITMTVTALNASGAADVAKWALIDRDLPLSFNFYRQNILSAGRRELELEQQALIDGMLAAYRVIEEHLPTRPFLNGLLDRVQAEAHTHTCGVGQSYVVVSHTGRIAQCQMHLDQPVGDDLDSDLMLTVAGGPLQNLSVEDKAGCRDCAYRYRCAGGCPLETFRATGRWDVQSPNCAIYQALLPEALRLEGLRLMKAHGYLS